MSEPKGFNNSTAVPNLTDSTPVPSSEPGLSASAQAGAQAPLPTGIAPQASTAQPDKTVFGLRQDANHYQPIQNVVNDDYEKQFPIPDPYSEETAPKARIWRVYNEEAAAYDAVYVGQARDGLDVMLVFAGLFSAVVTSFLVQVSQSLQADYTAMSAILLHDLVSIQLSIAEGSSSRPNISVPSINPLQTFRPDSIIVWVNGLWVVSLAMSLVVALSAVLVKQWFHHYASIPSGTPGARSHLRHYRFIGFKKWRVDVIIGLFPIIMHISLVLFLSGLILFFIPLRTSLACAVGVITVALCLLYLVSSAMPIFFPQCPYRTPLTDVIYHVYVPISWSSLQPIVFDMLEMCPLQILSFFHLDHIYVISRQPLVRFGRIPHVSRTLKQLETRAVKSDYSKISVDALDWLFNVSSNPTVHSLVIQAIGGLPHDVHEYAEAAWRNDLNIRSARDCMFAALGDSQHRAIGDHNVWERVARSHYFLDDCSSRCHRMLQLEVQNMNFNEPRFTATAWATFGMASAHSTRREIGPQSEFGRGWLVPGRDLRKFFCTYHGLGLHPFVWEELIRSAVAIKSQCFQVESLEDLSGPDYAYLVCLFLCASKSRDRVPTRRETSHRTAITLHEALNCHLGNFSQSIQDRLLDMLSSFEGDLPATLPPYHRILYKAAKFALHYLPDEFWVSYRGGGSCRYLELLSMVLQCLLKEYDTILVKHPCFMPPILELLRAVVDDTSICYYTAPGGLQPPKLHAVLDDLLSSTGRLLSLIVFSRQPEFVFPSFHRLLQVLAHDDLPSGQGPVADFACRTMVLMEVALEIGNEGIYQAFIAGEWIWMFAERYLVDLPNSYRCARPILAFTRGLQALDSASALEFFNYLQQPRHFIITFMMIASISICQADFKHLLKLCPTDSSSWDTHRTTLKGIIDWCQASNRTDLSFPLENFFGGKVVQTDEGAVSLDEALRKFFANGYRQWVIEKAALTIVPGHGIQPDWRRAFRQRI